MYTEHNIETTNILILVFFMAALVLQVELRTARATHYRRTLSISYSSRSQLGHSAPPLLRTKYYSGACLLSCGKWTNYSRENRATDRKDHI